MQGKIYALALECLEPLVTSLFAVLPDLLQIGVVLGCTCCSSYFVELAKTLHFLGFNQFSFLILKVNY